MRRCVDESNHVVNPSDAAPCLLEATRLRFVDRSSGWEPEAGWARKPMNSREGANIVMKLDDGHKIDTPGEYTNRK